MSTLYLEQMIRQANERRKESFICREREQVRFIQSLDMTPSEIDRYQSRVARIGECLSALLATRKKLRKRAELLIR